MRILLFIRIAYLGACELHCIAKDSYGNRSHVLSRGRELPEDRVFNYIAVEPSGREDLRLRFIGPIDFGVLHHRR